MTVTFSATPQRFDDVQDGRRIPLRRCVKIDLHVVEGVSFPWALHLSIRLGVSVGSTLGSLPRAARLRLQVVRPLRPLRGCGPYGWILGFIIRWPQTPLAATRPTSWATTGGRLALFTNMCQGVAR